MEAKGIKIDEKNRPMLASRFMVDELDWPDMLPLGYILVTDFGNDEKFDTLTQENLDRFFTVGEVIENGFFAITPTDEAMHWPR